MEAIRNIIDGLIEEDTDAFDRAERELAKARELTEQRREWNESHNQRHGSSAGLSEMREAMEFEVRVLQFAQDRKISPSAARGILAKQEGRNYIPDYGRIR